MSGKVIKRRFTFNKYNQIKEVIDETSTYSVAEKIAKKRLDHRRNYAIINGQVCVFEQFTRPCSGCSCDGEYPCSCCNERGAGCEECGYTGKVRSGYWMPFDGSEPK